MGLSNMEVKRTNRKSVLTFLLHGDVVTKNELSSVLHLSIPTVTQCLRELQEIGLVQEEGTTESMGGRKAATYRCLKDAKVAVGVDLTRSHVTIVLIDLSFQLLYYIRLYEQIHDDEQSYARLKELINNAIDTSGVKREDILGLGVSLPAIIDTDGKRILNMHEGMEIGFQVYDTMKDWFPFPIHLANDSRSAGRAEFAFHEGEENALYFFVHASVGGTFRVNGRLITGKNLRAGEFGHMTLVPGGRKCYCGRDGCVNAYCSTEILSDLTDGDLGEFFDRLKSGEKEYRDVWETYLDYLAVAIHNFMSSFDMKVIIGGSLGEYIGEYIDDLEKRVVKIDGYLRDTDFIEPAVLSYEAPAIGAAMLYPERYLDKI